ncbi:hypothetical protein MMC13_006392 [Lambiella insularis]|nr:hypothetical protein [Lambiella insularis]
MVSPGFAVLLTCILQIHSSVMAASGDTNKARPGGVQEALESNLDEERYKAACPEYQHYAVFPHRPWSEGPLALPYQRPSLHCRTFNSPLVEKVVEDVTSRMKDKDLARLFENAFPNTLDTTVRWHVDGSQKKPKAKHHSWGASDGAWEGSQSFIVTGDINAEWLRDSTNQLAQYQALASKDKKIENLILGAINTQAEYVIESPYCNAFQPPPPSQLQPTSNGQHDTVHPVYEQTQVFECKYELDSLAHFLALGNQFYASTKSTAYLTKRWYLALDALLGALREQSKPTFNETTGKVERNEYTFQRVTNVGTETLSLGGVGNPLNGGTGLVRSAFRPSDDATILGFFIPANAMMSVELKRTAAIVKTVGKDKLAEVLWKRAETIEKGVWEHGVVTHKKYGDVFAFEVDGYGSQILMDDANLPSLLALPLLGFVEVSDKTYQNTRKMILEKAGNPYYLTGKGFQAIGGPHIGLQHAWPMSRLVQAMTSNDDTEISDSLEAVLKTSKLGLVHESIHVDRVADYTRSWFAWANSVFAQTVLDVAARKPHLIFGKGSEPYRIE